MSEPGDPDQNAAARFVRPFTLTQGRTEPTSVHIAIEAIVSQGPDGLRDGMDLGPVETDIHRLAAEPLSTAELSARLGLPIGVVRVLVGDLVETGHVRLGQRGKPGDVELLRRLIDGIRSL